MAKNIDYAIWKSCLSRPFLYNLLRTFDHFFQNETVHSLNTFKVSTNNGGVRLFDSNLARIPHGAVLIRHPCHARQFTIITDGSCFLALLLNPK